MAFMKQQNATFIGAVDKTPDQVGKAYGIRAVPTFAVVNREGQQIDQFVGIDDKRLTGDLEKAGLKLK